MNGSENNRLFPEKKKKKKWEFQLVRLDVPILCQRLCRSHVVWDSGPCKIHSDTVTAFILCPTTKPTFWCHQSQTECRLNACVIKCLQCHVLTRSSWQWCKTFYLLQIWKNFCVFLLVVSIPCEGSLGFITGVLRADESPTRSAKWAMSRRRMALMHYSWGGWAGCKWLRQTETLLLKCINRSGVLDLIFEGTKTLIGIQNKHKLFHDGHCLEILGHRGIHRHGEDVILHERGGCWKPFFVAFSYNAQLIPYSKQVKLSRMVNYVVHLLTSTFIDTFLIWEKICSVVSVSASVSNNFIFQTFSWSHRNTFQGYLHFKVSQ